MDTQTMRPKVLVLTKLFWPEGGGAELATYLIVKEVLSKGFVVVVVSGTRRPKPDVLRAVDYVHWSTLESKYKPVEWLRLLASTRRFTKLVERADVIYIPSHTLIPMAMAARLVKPSVKVVLHLHNYQALTYTSIALAGKEPDATTDAIVEYREHGSLLRALFAGLGHYVNYVNRLAVTFADKVICVSQIQYEILLRYLPELREKAVVIYNPLPDLPFTEKKLTDEKLLLYLGGSSFVKGFHVLLKALDKIAKRHDDLRVVMTRVKRGKVLARNYMVCEELPYDEVVKLYARAYALLFPSLWEEPLPYVVVESMLMGTMPVAARVGGVPEVVRGSPAEEYLFTPGDVNEFVDNMEAILSQPRDSITDAGSKLREAVLKKFDSETIEKKLVEAFS